MRPRASSGKQAVAAWRKLHSDADAVFDHEVVIDAAQICPQVTWGTSPEMVAPIDAKVPDPAAEADAVKAEGMSRALAYMGLQAGTPIDRDTAGQGVHRFMHQFAHRGSARRRRCRQGPQGGR